LPLVTETDIRDRNRSLVIAHDPAGARDMPLEQFFKLYKSYKSDLPLALNIKADGLQIKLGALLRKHKVTNYFLFDMSIPDMRMCLAAGLRTYARVSDIERAPCFYKNVAGIWLDGFDRDWYKAKDIRRFLRDGKAVCLVSPELHQRDPRKVWAMLKANDVHHETNFTLCTDLPEAAARWFGVSP